MVKIFQVGLQLTFGTKPWLTLVLLYDMQNLQGPQILYAAVEQPRESFAHSPKKSTRLASNETVMAQPTIWHILCKHFHVKAY